MDPLFRSTAPTPVDRFAAIGKAHKNDAGDGEKAGLKCEMKTYESRYDSKGRRVRLRVGMRLLDPDLDPNQDHVSAFVLTRFYDTNKELEYTQLDIRSPYIKKALQEKIVRYPGIDFHAKVVTITGPLRCIFHYRNELQEYGSALAGDEKQAEHLIFFLEYMYEVLAEETQTWYNHMSKTGVVQRLNFLGLWMAFRPGDLVYTRTNGIDRVLKLVEMTRCDCPNPYCWRRRWTIHANEITFDGDDYGYETHYFSIFPYKGYLPLDQLKIFPLEYHPKKDKIRSSLIARGRKFLSLQGIHYRAYDGVAEALSPWRMNTLFGEEDEFPLQTMMIKGRVMIDSKTFSMMKASNKIVIDDELEFEKTEGRDSTDPNLNNDDILICTYKTPGFCFTTKRWSIFQVEYINEIEFNSHAFEALLLPQHQKDMINSLVRIHSSGKIGFDDLIKGKGKGMVFFTSRCAGSRKDAYGSVADYTKRSLYTVNCGELGVDITSVEANLSDALRLATTWNAIVLIDEADIFLEARNGNDLTRNGLVSIFLRLLEYYEGILILTTNRIQVFDPAFKSRIHLAIKYHSLTSKSRRDLWKMFITSASSDVTPAWFNDEVLGRLGAENINGRQIKNTVSTAQALAISENSLLGVKHIDLSLTAMSMFEMDFQESVEDDADRTMPEFISKRHREH